MHQRVDRRHLRFAVYVTVLAVPILVLDNIPRHDAQAEQLTQTGAGLGSGVSNAIAAQRAYQAGAAQRQQALAAPVQVAVPPSTAPATTAAPTTAPPSTAPPTTRAPQPTVSVPPSTTPPPAPPPAPPNPQEGGGSWYRQPSHWPPNGCAHTTLPFGTLVTVTNLSTGGSTTCVVNDRGPYVHGRVIDLDDDVFERLAPLSQGLIPVRLTW